MNSSTNDSNNIVIQRHQVQWLIESYERFINEISKDNINRDKITANFTNLKEEIFSENQRSPEEFAQWVAQKKSMLKTKLKDNMVLEPNPIKKPNLSRIDKKSRIRLFQRICLFSYKREEIDQFFDCLRVQDHNEILEETVQAKLNFVQKSENSVLSKVESIDNIEEIQPQHSGIIKFFCKREGKSNFRIFKHASVEGSPDQSGIKNDQINKNPNSKFVQRIFTNFFVCYLERKGCTVKEIMNVQSDLINITNHQVC